MEGGGINSASALSVPAQVSFSDHTAGLVGNNLTPSIHIRYCIIKNTFQRH